MKKLITSASLLLIASLFRVHAQTNDLTNLHSPAFDFTILSSMRQADGEKPVESDIAYHHTYYVQLSRDFAEKMNISQAPVKMEFRIDTFYKKITSLEEEFTYYKADTNMETTLFKTFRPRDYSGKSGNARDLALIKLQDGVVRYRTVKPNDQHGWLHEAMLVVPLAKADRYASIRFLSHERTGTINYKQLDTFLEILYATVSPNMHF